MFGNPVTVLKLKNSVKIRRPRALSRAYGDWKTARQPDGLAAADVQWSVLAARTWGEGACQLWATMGVRGGPTAPFVPRVHLGC